MRPAVLLEAGTVDAFAGIRVRLEAAGIKPQIHARAKHFYSIHKKMVNRQRRFEDIYDLMAVRIIVPTAT